MMLLGRLSLVAVSRGYSLLLCVDLLQWLLLLWSLNSRVHKLSCSMACGILPHKGSNPCSPALEGRFLTNGPPGRSLPYFTGASESPGYPRNTGERMR